MRKFWVLCFLLIISFNFLNAMQLILHNDRVITGKFIKVDKESVVIFSQEKLVTVSLHTIVTIFDDEMNEIPRIILASLKKGRINFNGVKGEIKITPSNIERTSLIFPGKSTFINVYLKDSSKYYGSMEGNDGSSIMIYNPDENTFYLIIHKDIKKIVNNSVDVTEDILSYIDGIDFFLIESFKIVNESKYGKQINAYQLHKKRKRFFLTVGCDFGLSHIIKGNIREYHYKLKPSGYAKFEVLNKDNQAGFGIGFQIYKEITYSGGAACSFIPIYLVFAKRPEPTGFKMNLGVNLFFGNHRYNPSKEFLLPGFYVAVGPTFPISDKINIEMMYTLNNGNVYSVLIFNQSVSIGFTLK